MKKRNFVLGTILCASVSLYALSVSAEWVCKYDANGNLIEKKQW